MLDGVKRLGRVLQDKKRSVEYSLTEKNTPVVDFLERLKKEI